jgi:cell division protein FtsB
MNWLKILKNRYFVVFVLFAVWIVFFDSSSVQDWMSQKSINRNLNREIEKYVREADEIARQTAALKLSNDSLEKFARETYYMKKDGEDIFIIKKDE